MGEEEASHPWGFLPTHLWASIARCALGSATAEGHVEVLRTVSTLLAVSHHVAASVMEVPLQLDLSAAPEADLALLPPLLLRGRLPLAALRLGPRHAAGEALLRQNCVVEASGRSLRVLAATVACTDTLQRFTGLLELHLHAGVLERLYPAVLEGLPCLHHLGLHHYRQVELLGLPPGVAASLQTLEITPRPEARRCHLEARLPLAARLRSFTVHGSFERVTSSAAAPELLVDTQALARQCDSAHLEAQWAVFQLPSLGGQDPEVAVAGVLLAPGATWHRLELHVLEGACVKAAAAHPGQGLEVPWMLLDLEKLGQSVNDASGGSVRACLRRDSVSILHPWVLLLERQEGGAGGAA